MLEKVIEIIIDQTCAPLAFTLQKFFLYHLPTRGRAGIKLGMLIRLQRIYNL